MMRIEKNVPLPKHLADRVNLGDLPLARMKVGDSIVIGADSKKDLSRKLKSVRMRALRFSKKHPHFKFKTAQETGTNGVAQIRVWRVSRAS
tara:strand:- start:230 stop:502 length:273 start_codon:yes stop_codon:yes gene_type:complete